jgi:ABC-type lipoprotein release transport system permease subunit
MLDPDLKIIPVEGKVFDPTTDEMKMLFEKPEILMKSNVLQENALVVYGDRQVIATLKGVDPEYHELTLIDTAIVDGTFKLSEGDYNYSVLGIGIAASLGVNAGFAYPLEICMPKRNENVNMANPAASMNVEYAQIGGVFHTNQVIYDDNFILVDIDLLREILDYEKEVSALELKLKEGVDVKTVKKNISNILGDGFLVQDRYEQQSAAFNMFQVEKWVTYLMLCFILALALFNMVGSIAILMIEKQDDIKKLNNLGADNRFTNRIFLYEGWMICLLGSIIGIIIGLILCLLQQEFGFISMGQEAGTFIIDAYPIKIELTDMLIIFSTVLIVGFFASFYPVHFLGKKWINRND